MMVFGIIVAVISVLMLIGAILHATYFKEKIEHIKSYGKLVNVEDGQMHVFSIGNGEKTIVLLPGMGVSLPSAEFAPLMRTLNEKYTVVCVEYFGVGFSSETSKPRTCENYVEEIRTALNQAGFKAPYVLMPHSISSVYSEYYAAKYPDEVKAIISLDGTTTAHDDYQDIPAIVKSILPVAKFQQAIGFTSLLAPLTINYQTSNQQLKQMKMTPQEYQQKHLKRIGEHAQYEILDGTHFIYVNNVEKISKITDRLLLKAN